MIQQKISRRFIFTLCLLLCAIAPRSITAQQTNPSQTPAPLTRPTVLSRPAPPSNSVQPAPSADTARPVHPPPVVGMRGALVQTLDGRTLLEQSADQGFNPASAVKLATALAALRTFGPQHRFETGVWTNGKFDRATGIITGDLILTGRDPSFHYEHGVMLAQELNRLGVRTVTGRLIVAPRFTMNFDSSAQRSATQLRDTLDAARRPAAAARAWTDERMVLGDKTSLQSVPGVAIMGAVDVDSAPPRASLLLVHRSSKLTDILKVLLCYSNNFMAERIGDTLGGPQAVRRLLVSDAGVRPDEVRLSTTSGLGVNRVTPRAMMKIYRALRDELAKNNLSPSDILPVAGVDPGTLKKRYTFGTSRGSVIAKTGTLVRTDGGASALVGQMRTGTGETLLFVIFNQRGPVHRFRENQDALVTQLQNSYGGPTPFAYRPLTLAMRLADTESQSKMPARKDEYEPN